MAKKRRSVFYLAEWRDKRGFTQAAFAAAVGTRQATISDLERDKSKVVRIDHLRRMAEVLRIAIYELFLPPPEKK